MSGPAVAPVVADGLVVGDPAGAGPRTVSLSLQPGLTWVRGGEGTGKTTLIRLLAGDDAPRSGRVVRSVAPVLRPDASGAADDAIVARDWLARLRPRCPDWDAQAQAALIERFGLSDHADKPLFMLSAGSRRKVALVAAFASRAPVVLLDGPHAALDARSRDLLTGLLREAARARVQAWAVADHELPDGLPASECVAVLDLGD